MAKIFYDLKEFYEAIDPKNHDYDRIMWIRNNPNYKIVKWMWVFRGEYDGGETFIYRKLKA